jgi:hypothetical protein
LRIGSPTKLADLQFADQSKEICGLAYISEICRLKKTVAWPSLQIYSGAWGKLIHEKNQKSKISWHCPFKLSLAWTKLYIVKTADSRCHSLAGNYIP